jgi:hypothetical protein
MTLNNWLAILAIIAAATVSLIVAHLHRKQMRQIELHRLDPTVPLTPPPSPVTRFLRNYGPLILNLSLNVGILVNELRKTGPITKAQIFTIALSTAGLAVAFMLELQRQLELRVYNTIDKLVNLIGGIHNIIDHMTGAPRK